MPVKRVKFFIFLKDVLLLAFTAFGGPQAHITLLFDLMVKKRKYLTEEELIELHALCQILPGPTSTQTITAIGFKLGGPNLAYLALLVWIFPAVCLMIAAAVAIAEFQQKDIPIYFTKFIQPMAVGFVAVAAFKISSKVVITKLGITIMIISAIISYFFPSPYLFPIMLFAGGSITASRFRSLERIHNKNRITIDWRNFLLWAGVFILAASLGGITRLLPVRLFENFYRNGSLIFGGGQVLVPLLFTEFVEYKRYLSSEEFLSGFALVQAVPGPTFSFTAYIGSLSMRQYGIFGEILGGFTAAFGIFLPGTFLIFFVIRFWGDLKQYRGIKASLEGINATSSGMVTAAALLLFQPIDSNFLNISIIILTFVLLMFTRLPAPFIIIAGLLAGFIA
ncbi:chromate transporter [soil metagenome]